MQDKIRKLKAIKKLAESGVGGEKEAAKQTFEKLSKKWNISLQMLQDEKIIPTSSNYYPQANYSSWEEVYKKMQQMQATQPASDYERMMQSHYEQLRNAMNQEQNIYESLRTKTAADYLKEQRDRERLDREIKEELERQRLQKIQEELAAEARVRRQNEFMAETVRMQEKYEEIRKARILQEQQEKMNKEAYRKNEEARRGDEEIRKAEKFFQEQRERMNEEKSKPFLPRLIFILFFLLFLVVTMEINK